MTLPNMMVGSWTRAGDVDVAKHGLSPERGQTRNEIRQVPMPDLARTLEAADGQARDTGCAGKLQQRDEISSELHRVAPFVVLHEQQRAV